MTSSLVAVWACEIVLPWLLGATVDAAIDKRDAALIFRLGLAMTGLTCLLYGVHVIYLRLESALVASASFRLRRFLYVRLFEQPVSFFARHKGGELGHRIMDDAGVIEKHGVYLLADAPFAALTVLGVVTVMFCTHAGLTLAVLAILSVAAVLSQRIGRPLTRLEKSVNALYARMGGRLQEMIAGVRTIKAFGQERREIGTLDGVGQEIIDAETRTGGVAAKLEPLIELMETGGLVAVVWCGASLIASGALTPGKLVAFIAYMELLSEPLQRAGRYYRQFLQARGTLTRIADLIRQMPPVEQRGEMSVAGPLCVSFEDVSFTFPDGRQPAVDRVTLEARPGEIVAIVGPNGAGKSTLMDLLLGFHEPSHGRIVAGGVDLSGWDRDAWRAATAAVSQDVFLFHATLAENLRYGRPDASDADIEEIVRRVGLEPLARRLPRGLGQMLGDRGTKLSGGERQRAALARALIRSPRVLVFDEPTSALDGAAAKDASRVIRENARDCVTFLIAHSRGAVAMADRIVLMDHGRVVAAGRAEVVEAESELFRKLFTVAA